MREIADKYAVGMRITVRLFAALRERAGGGVREIELRGGSCIVDPLGNVLVEPDFTGEAIKLAEIDRRLIARGKYDLDVVGHYARPDVFKLSVDTRPKPAVAFGARPAPLVGQEPSAQAELLEKAVLSD